MKRNLTNNERELLLLLVSSTPSEMTDNLEAQVNNLLVTGGKPTMLELEVDRNIPGYEKNIEPGPLPIRLTVKNNKDEPSGELILWTTDGYLSLLEYAWYTDEMPSELPTPSQVQIISE